MDEDENAVFEKFGRDTVKPDEAVIDPNFFCYLPFVGLDYCKFRDNDFKILSGSNH